MKAAVQNVLAVMPRGRELNHLLQRRLTHTLPGDDDHFRLKARKAYWHFQALGRHLHEPSGALRLFEFGAGWDLIGPLINFGLGVDSQVLIDVAQLVDFDLVSHSIRQYTKLTSELEATWGRPLRPLGDPLLFGVADLKERFGIEYYAPRDARATGLPAGSIDFVTSTSTLQHVPEQDILPILQECHRLLRAGGLISAHIDMPDGFAQFDHAVSPYNFLQFSDRTWSLVNSALYYQNRLRAQDFLSLFNRAGFKIVEQVLADPTPDQLRTVRELSLAPRFRRYPPEQLAIQQASIVGVK